MDLGRERRGQGAQSQEGPGGAPREDDRPAEGTGLWGLLWAGILQARNNCLSATAQLPAAGISDPGGLLAPSMGTWSGVPCPLSRQAIPREGAQGLQKAGYRRLLPTGELG